MKNFGDKLFERVNHAKSALFIEGEMTQLSYISYEKFIQLVEESKDEKHTLSYPVGYKADNTAINSTKDYTKQELIDRYKFLSLVKLPINGIFQLITIMESLLGEIIREILIEYPVKIPNRRKLDVETALGANSLEEIKISIVNSILNEIAYKSPKEFTAEFEKYVGVNLLEQPAYHRYIEVKATRDIHIHNSGIANEIYLAKAATLARVKNGIYLPVTIQYFLQAYESCLQITEVLEVELNKIWPSPLFNDRNKTVVPEKEKDEVVDEIIKESKEESKSE